jgi:hypothetical protein
MVTPGVDDIGLGDDPQQRRPQFLRISGLEQKAVSFVRYHFWNAADSAADNRYPECMEFDDGTRQRILTRGRNDAEFCLRK